jgi:starch-binding outer membrane protein, SusD/RagB family
LPAGAGTEYAHANQAAVQMLLAKLYLNAEVYKGVNKYTECATYCERVIAQGYQLDNNYQDLFLADNQTSSEIIFPVVYDGLYAQTWGGTTFLTCAALGGSMVAADYGVNAKWGGLRVTPQYVDLYTDSMLDSRYLFYRDGQQKEITTLGTFSNGYGFPKFKNKTKGGANGSNGATSAQVDIDYPMFRLADAYLMYAEAALRGGGSVGQGVIYMNRLRERAYGNTSFNFGSITLEDVLSERAKELSWECTRRTDLIRFGKFTGGSYVWSFKGGDAAGGSVPDFRSLYPIPTADLVLNPNLIQNSGY